jgi:uncharacterized protein YjbI with pentapeptide repeats
MNLQIVTKDELINMLVRHANWLSDDQLNTQYERDQLSLIDSSLVDFVVQNQNFSNAEIVRCRFRNVLFKNCDFSYSILIDSSFRGCRFEKCSFFKADLRSADFYATDLAGSDFTRADLTDAVLRSANLTEAILSWAWLVNTDLRDANLEHVQFEGTRFVNTKMYNQNKYELGTTDQAVIRDIDLTPEATGSKDSGPEALEQLKRQIK